MLLKKIKDFVQTQNPEMGPPVTTKLMDSNGQPRPVNIPDEFRCPISLELMKDPVIVATGQVPTSDSTFSYSSTRLLQYII